MTGDRGCPECGETNDLATIERLIGVARMRVTEAGDVEYEGETTISWDTTETVGVQCGCGWEVFGDDWASSLTRGDG